MEMRLFPERHFLSSLMRIPILVSRLAFTISLVQRRSRAGVCLRPPLRLTAIITMLFWSPIAIPMSSRVAIVFVLLGQSMSSLKIPIIRVIQRTRALLSRDLSMNNISRVPVFLLRVLLDEQSFFIEAFPHGFSTRRLRVPSLMPKSRA
jgi:hypothetical protein